MGVFYLILLINLTVFMPVSCGFYYYCSVVQIEIMGGNASRKSSKGQPGPQTKTASVVGLYSFLVHMLVLGKTTFACGIIRTPNIKVHL